MSGQDARGSAAGTIEATQGAPAPAGRFAAREPIAFWSLVAIIAWAPFPIGSNHPWSWTVLAILIALNWVLVVAARVHRPGETFRKLAPLSGPILLATLALDWAFAQTVPGMPGAWIHPEWTMAAEALRTPISGVISLDPWRTTTEIMKLLGYATAAGASYLLCSRRERAKLFLDCLIAIIALYCAYALILDVLGTSQFHILYNFITPSGAIAGPLVNRNNFATYAGIGALCAIARLSASASDQIRTGRGIRQTALSALNFLLGRGAVMAVAVVLTISSVIASASRAGFLSFIAGCIAIAAVYAGAIWRRGGAIKSLAGTAALVAATVLLFNINGDVLVSRLGGLADAGGSDQTRVDLWAAAWRMIQDAPLLGLGLGTFENAYPLYADHALPFVFDKAHQDYLELAAGLGLPAAAAWVGALAWSAVLCAAAPFRRRRDRIYPMVAFGATAVVATHSAFDFSLQIPAVALTFSVILGMGLAQAFPTRDT